MERVTSGRSSKPRKRIGGDIEVDLVALLAVNGFGDPHGERLKIDANSLPSDPGVQGVPVKDVGGWIHFEVRVKSSP